MTMPTERTRALKWAREFLEEIPRMDNLPDKLSWRANVILRHFPEDSEIEHLHMLAPLLIAHPDDPETR